MRVLGLDLSLTRSGVATEDGTRVITYPKMAGMERLDAIAAEVRACASGAGLVVIEGYSYASKGSSVISLGELGGLIRWTLWTLGFPYTEVAPGCAKKFATGSGVAKKPDMLDAARRAGYKGSNDDNCVDAYWLRQMGLYRLGCADVPATAYRDEAVNKVQWPELEGTP